MTGGLSERLRRSHLLVAALGVAALLVALIANLALSNNADQLAQRWGPETDAANRSLIGLEASLAALRGWAAIGDPAMRARRQATWKNDIRPAFAELQRLNPGDEQLAEIAILLDELEEWQWVIEDVARTPGNHPATAYYRRRVAPSARSALGASSALIALEHARTAGAPRTDLLYQFGQLRISLSRADARLNSLVVGGHSDSDVVAAQLQSALAIYAQLDAARSRLDPDQLAQLDRLARDLPSMQTHAAHAGKLAQAPDADVSAFLLSTEAAPRANKLVVALRDRVASAHAEMERREQRLAVLANLTVGALVLLTLGLVFAALRISSRRARAMLDPIQALVAATSSLSEGDDLAPLPVQGDDELAELSRAFNRMAQRLSQTMGSVVAANRQLEDSLARRGAQAELGVVLSADVPATVLARRVLDYCVPRTDALTGVMHLDLDGASPGDDPGVLALSDSGLPAEVAAQKQLRHLRGLPDGYPAVSTGLGQAVPRHLVLVPLTAAGKTVGVMELCWFDPPSADALSLLEDARDPTGQALARALSHARVNRLLAQSQAQSEELQVQQEEIRVTNEALSARTDKLEQSERSLQDQQAELQAINEELRVQNETLDESRERLERATQYKSEFLANMSHELRTPLNSILILAEMLSQRGSSVGEDKLKAWSSTIHRSGRNLLDLINDVLDLSKVEAGHIEVVLEPVDLADLLAGLGAELGPLAEDRGLDYVVDVDAAVPPTVSLDRRLVGQILRNLLGNAIKFTEQGSVTLSVTAPDSLLRFTVQDTGVGIPAGQQDQVFEAFRQVDGTITRTHGGTGLGLSICRKLAHELNGELRLASEFGVGSTFTLDLPLHHAAKAEDGAGSAAPRRQDPPAHARSVTAAPHRQDAAPAPILVIEDDPAYAELLADIARDEGYPVQLAADFEQGFEMALVSRPCAILLDVGLPRVDGWTGLKALRADPRTADIPVHVFTAQADPSAPPDATEPVHEKPTQAADIRALLAQSMSGPARRVLLVEDDPDHRATLASLLRSDGIDVVAVGSVAAGLEALEKGSFSGALVDLGLPDGDAHSLLEQARARGIAPEHVIVHTGRDLDEQALRLVEADADLVVIKGTRSAERLRQELRLFFDGTVRPQQRGEPNRGGRLDGRRVLLVDDDMRNLFSVGALLEGAGIEVIEAVNGAEALERLEEESVDAVLMDVMMPVMDGLAATRELRARGHRDLPVIALTAKAMPGDREACLEAGANDYVTKPVDAQALLSVLRVWLEGA